jgi:hypothetical protein
MSTENQKAVDNAKLMNDLIENNDEKWIINEQIRRNIDLLRFPVCCLQIKI